MPKSKPPYPPEFRIEAVRLVRDGGRKISNVARDLGMSVASLRNSMRQEEIDTGDRAGLSTSEREELQRLRREVRRLQEEREILRKSAVFFAHETHKNR